MTLEQAIKKLGERKMFFFWAPGETEWAVMEFYWSVFDSDMNDPGHRVVARSEISWQHAFADATGEAPF